MDQLPGLPGSGPEEPIERVLPSEEGWVLTDLGRGAVVGPRPIGDNPGAHLHHNVGVPLAAVYPFLVHVLARTWRDRSTGYLTREHLADALAYTDEAGARYIGWRATGRVPEDLEPARRLVPIEDLPAREPGQPAWNAWTSREVLALRGHLALLYVTLAAMANGAVDTRMDKAHAAVLPRVDPALLLGQLPERIRQFLATDTEALWQAFEASLRGRMPDFDQLARAMNPTEPAGSRVSVARTTRHGRYLWDFMLSGLDQDHRNVVGLRDVLGMTVLPALDEDTGGTLPLVVVEVRSYGARHLTARDAEERHRRLTREAVLLHERVRRLPAAEGGQVLREAYRWSVRQSAPAQLFVEAPVQTTVPSTEPLRPRGGAPSDDGSESESEYDAGPEAELLFDTGGVPAKWVLPVTPVTVKQRYMLGRLLESAFPEGGAAAVLAAYPGLNDADRWWSRGRRRCWRRRAGRWLGRFTRACRSGCRWARRRCGWRWRVWTRCPR